MSVPVKRSVTIDGGAGPSRNVRARGSKFVRGRRYRRRSSYRRLAPTSLSGVASLARRVALNCAETKVKTISVNEATIDSLASPHYTVLTDDSMKLTQGTGYSNMQGHSVNGVGLDTHFYLQNKAEACFVKLMLIYSSQGILPADTGAGTAALNENNAGDVSLANNVLDLGLRINGDFFNVLKEWNYRLSAGTGTETFDNIMTLHHWLPFKGRKFQYNGTNTHPCNGRFFYVIMVRRADNDGTGATDVELSLTSHFYFKDP